MRMSGSRVSTDGRLSNWSRKRSQIASLIFSVVNSRLFSGDLIAVTSTRIVWSHVEPVFPRLRQRQVVDVVFVDVAGVRHAHQHARCDARVQVDAVGVGQRARAVHAARYLVVHLQRGALLGDLVQFFGQRGFQAARAGAEIGMRM